MKRVRRRNVDLYRTEVEALPTEEHFDLFRRYVSTRHGDGGMEEMDFDDYGVMVSGGATKSCLVEYRIRDGDQAGELVGVCLADGMCDGLSLVYSFYAPESNRRSLGNYIILDHLSEARARNLPFVYLGFWVRESPKMSYKARFQPCEGFIRDQWVPLNPKTLDPDTLKPDSFFQETILQNSWFQKTP